MKTKKIQGFEEFKDIIEWNLEKKNYTKCRNTEFLAARYLEQPIYAKRVLIGKNAMDGDYRCTFIIYHPVKYPECLIIEPRWQQSSGSTEKKLYHLRDTLKMNSDYKAIIMLAGEGQSETAINFLRNSIGDNLSVLFSLDEFQIWLNDRGL